MPQLPLLPKGQLSVNNPTPSGTTFPPNLAAVIPEDMMRKMTGYLVSNYLLPQIMERRSYEQLWDLLLQMYKVKMSTDNLHNPKTLAKDSMDDRQSEVMQNSKAQVSDSLVYDAVDRLSNLNHFISWKDGAPIAYQVPQTFKTDKEDEFYYPEAEKFSSFNGLLDWNIRNQDVYRKHLILTRHHYLYGLSFVGSNFIFKQEPVIRQNNQGQQIQNPEITDIGTSFEPISIRRIWLNYRQPVYDMDFQPCPFYFQQMPRFAILQNQYDPVNNPFGFVNLDTIGPGQWMFSAPEMEEARKALAARLDAGGDRGQQGGGGVNSTIELIAPEFSVEALWTFHPMIPLDPQTGEFEFRADGKTPVPMKRFIWQVFATNLMAGKFNTIRLQENFYPRNCVPIYGSQHMPDLDSGLYSPAIGEILENHYKEICTAMNQFIDNKNLINNPPSWAVIGTPAAANSDRNAPGSDLKVTGPNDVGWRQVYDGTNQTVEMIKFLREQGQTSSKAVDAILGKALGGRTSATEAQNVFQAAMSGVTTDINLFNYDIMGGYATKVWEFTGLWFSPELLKTITGMFGPQLTPEDMWMRVDLKWDVGSTYIESIVKQGNIRYALQAAVNSPVLNQAILWRLLFEEFRMPECAEAIQDSGFQQAVFDATEEAMEVYLGQAVIFDPTANHQVYIEVLVRFLKDKDSHWNKEYGALPAPVPNQKGQPQSRAQYLADLIQMHQQFAILQMQQQAAQMHLVNAAQDAHDNPPEQQDRGTPSLPSGQTPQTAGDAMQAAQG